MSRLPLRRRSRARAAMYILLVAGLVASLATILYMVIAGPSVNAGGLMLGLVSLMSAIIMFLWPEKTQEPACDLADDLAETLREQWLDEAQARRLRDPGVIPLSWAATDRDDIADDPAISTRLRVRRKRLSGRLDGNFDEVVQRLADDYTHLERGRLVLLGEPGAGKSVLAMLMTLGLLNARKPGGMTPVLLSASSWDPLSVSLDAWIVRSLAALYYNDQPETPRRLLLSGLLLPVLDGLDEMPESARRGAVHEINRAVGNDRPVIVTCRSAEYTDVIRGGAPVLHGAPVVEMLPLPAGDVIAYLSSITWPPGTAWESVYAELHAAAHDGDPDRPVAQALSTPLMVSLARFTYERCGGHPSDLLDRTRFESRHLVEDYIIDQVIDGAYAPRYQPMAQPVEPSKWSAPQAKKWLRFLASYLHQHQDRDLAWWLLPRLLPPWIAFVLGIVGGGTVAVLIILGLKVLIPDDEDLSETVAFGCVMGILFALLTVMIWFAAGDRHPGRLSLSSKGAGGRLRGGFRTGMVISGVVCGIPLVVVTAVLRFGGMGLTELGIFCQLLAEAAAVSLVVGLALAVHRWLNAPAERSARADPLRFVRQDRRSSLIGAVCAGLAVNVLVFPILIGAGFLGTSLGQAIAHDPAWTTAWSHLTRDATFAIGVAWNSVDDKLSLVLAFFLPGVIFAGLVLLLSAWPRFVVARTVLAMRGRLPWRLIGFLADAREKGLLRQVSGVYQFRHIRFQERLATRPTGLTEIMDLSVYKRQPTDKAVAVLSKFGVDYQLIAMNEAADVVAVSTADGRVEIWDRGQSGFGESPRATWPLPGPLRAMTFSADGSTLALAIDRSVYFMTPDLSFKDRPFLFYRPISTLVLDKHGRNLVVVDDEHRIMARDLRSRTLRGCDLTVAGAKPKKANLWYAHPLWIDWGGRIEGINHDETPEIDKWVGDPMDLIVATCEEISVYAISSGSYESYSPHHYDGLKGAAVAALPNATAVFAEFTYEGLLVTRVSRDASNPNQVHIAEGRGLDVGYAFEDGDYVAISPGGAFLAATFGGILRLWNVSDVKERRDETSAPG